MRTLSTGFIRQCHGVNTVTRAVVASDSNDASTPGTYRSCIVQTAESRSNGTDTGSGYVFISPSRVRLSGGGVPRTREPILLATLALGAFLLVTRPAVPRVVFGTLNLVGQLPPLLYTIIPWA